VDALFGVLAVLGRRRYKITRLGLLLQVVAELVIGAVCVFRPDVILDAFILVVSVSMIMFGMFLLMLWRRVRTYVHSETLLLFLSAVSFVLGVAIFFSADLVVDVIVMLWGVYLLVKGLFLFVVWTKMRRYITETQKELENV
jgi:uncharacterized membrane protein HdeD (DUF308 family)